MTIPRRPWTYFLAGSCLIAAAEAAFVSNLISSSWIAFESGILAGGATAVAAAPWASSREPAVKAFASFGAILFAALCVATSLYIAFICCGPLPGPAD